MNNLIFKAAQFAKWAHRNQFRRDTNLPYFDAHVAPVAGRVMTVIDSENAVCAAYLHDVVEDCGVSLDLIRILFNSDIANMVDSLTKVSDLGSEESNEQATLNKITNAYVNTKIIKAIDRELNVIDFLLHCNDPAKCAKYVNKTKRLLAVLTRDLKPNNTSSLVHYTNLLEKKYS